MTDIVERLRDWDRLTVADAMRAADEIERLRHPKIIVGSRKVWEAMGKIISEAEVRNAALEEAALAAEDTGKRAIIEGYGMIVFAIRALKEKASDG